MTKKLNLTGGNWKEFETDKPFHPYHDRAWRIFSSHAGGELRGIAAEVYKKEDAAMMAASKAMYEALEEYRKDLLSAKNSLEATIAIYTIENYPVAEITEKEIHLESVKRKLDLIEKALKQARGEHDK
jgi:hypothetical protein